MSKSQDQESLDKIKQQLNEEYQNLTYLETGWAALGIETGNTKYDELNKKYLDLNKGNLGIIQTVTQAVSDGASALQFTWETAQVLPDLLTEFNNLKAAKNAADSAGSIEAGSKMIKDAESLIKKCAGILHSESISDSSKEAILESTIIPYVLTPILNKRFGKITKDFQTSETEKINVLDGISPKFIRELSTLGVDIISKALESDLNPKVQGIYKNIKQKNESSQANILQNIREIITSDKLNPILKKDLVNFLKKPESQKEIAQFAENIINNKAQKFANPELIKIADKINKREYGGVIVPAFKLLADPKVLGLVAKSIVNLGTSTLSKKPVGPHTNKVLEERQNNVGKQTSRGA